MGNLLQGCFLYRWALAIFAWFSRGADGSCVRRGISLRGQLQKQGIWLRWLLYIGAVLLILVCGIWGPGYDASTFIYSQF